MADRVGAGIRSPLGASLSSGGVAAKAIVVAAGSRYSPPMVTPRQAADGFRSYTGQLLLAMPDMPDANFRHAVIAMCVHDGDGAMGIDIGSTIDGLGLRALMDNFGIDSSNIADAPVHRGGPVEPRRGFVLHSLDWESEHMMPVAPGWGLSGSLDILKDIAAGRGPARFIAALGYAGWGAGQLEEEMTRPGWFVGKAHDTILFDTPAHQRWSKTFALNGVDPGHIIAQSGHA
jgi:putative transcriptional regulator